MRAAAMARPITDVAHRSRWFGSTKSTAPLTHGYYLSRQSPKTVSSRHAAATSSSAWLDQDAWHPERGVRGHGRAWPRDDVRAVLRGPEDRAAQSGRRHRTLVARVHE